MKSFKPLDFKVFVVVTRAKRILYFIWMTTGALFPNDKRCIWSGIKQN
jgi:hypothetical protein